MLRDMELTVKQVQQNVKEAQDRQKSYVDLKRTFKEFEVGNHVYVKVIPRKNSLRLGNCVKLSPMYCGPFEILARIRSVAYQLALPATIKVHNVFHVSLLKKSVHDATHVIIWTEIQVELEGEFQVEPKSIIDRREHVL